MTKSSLLLLSFLLPLIVLAKGEVNIAEDDASQGAYNTGWKTGDNGGSGFGAWTLQNQQAAEGGESHSGFFIGSTTDNSDLNGAAIKNKAFGEFANGVGFEAAVAFRAIERPLAVGDTFSFLMEHGPIEKKFNSDDPATGAVGLTLRAGNQDANCDDYNKGARFEFGFYEGKNNYQIYDGTESQDTGVSYTDAGVSISLTLVTPDTYDLEITTLGEKKTTKLSGRKLGGAAGSALESFCIFNRDGEKFDAYFNGFQVSKAP